MTAHCCETVLSHDKHNADAYHLIGLCALKRGKLEKAFLMVDAAIREDSTFSDFHRSMGSILKKMGKTEKALWSYQKALTLNPDDLIATYEAGALNQKLRKFETAARYYRVCLDKKFAFKECLNNLGLTYKAMGNMQAAIRCLRKAVMVDPLFAAAYNNLGIALKETGNLPSAINAFQAAIKANSEYAEAYYNQGNVLGELGLYQKASHAYKQALQIKPDFIEVHNNLGISLNKSGYPVEALEAFERAIRLNPANANAYLNAGIINYHQGKLELAIECTRSAIERAPCESKGYLYLFEQLRAACCWDELSAVEGRVDQYTNEALSADNLPDESPFLSITRSEDRQRHLKIASRWSREIKVRSERMGRRHYHYDVRPKETLTIGFLSNRFKNAATGHLMAGMFGYFNKKRFKLNCYSWGENDGSYFRKSIEKACDCFIDITGLGLSATADLINAHKVDVLIDLKGFSRNNRMEICAFKPAPIQIAYMNYNSTSGADFIDYIIGDETVTPKAHLADFSEKVIVMPHTFMVTDTGLAIANEKERAEEGLPQDCIIFCSFNQAYKIDPCLFDSWVTILNQVDNSVLWLLHDNDLAVTHLKREARHRGIDPSRLVFAKKTNKSDHLSRMRLADLVLDSWLYNGHTSTVDALIAGVPVITKEGQHFASRVSSSLLRAIGLETLICNDEMEYTQKAIHLAQHPLQLADLKNVLSKNTSSYPLFDTKRFVRNLENGFEMAWEICLAAKKPRHIYIHDNAPNTHNMV
ncbi:putative UDP-N-acetylglucosamine--peptide N-acetylglucosaminyltransferase SEC [Desulfosarcina variabilis str. Montpellier]